MSCAADGALAVGVDTKDHAGGEASLEAAAQPIVQLRKQPCGGRIVVSQCTHGTHDERNGHRGHQPFAAHVAQDH